MPTPRKPGESEDAFVSRCMSYMNDKHPDKPQKQQLAICYQYAGEKKAGKKSAK